jgi:acylphosphatase
MCDQSCDGSNKVTQAARRYLARGRVQAVGFRFFVLETACRLELHGFVRNLPDGRTVEAVASGPGPRLDDFAAALRQGPPGAVVSNLEIEPASDPGGDGFTIR